MDTPTKPLPQRGGPRASTAPKEASEAHRTVLPLPSVTHSCVAQGHRPSVSLGVPCGPPWERVRGAQCYVPGEGFMKALSLPNCQNVPFVFASRPLQQEGWGAGTSAKADGFPQQPGGHSQVHKRVPGELSSVCHRHVGSVCRHTRSGVP